VLRGYVAFLDPPKDTAGLAIEALHKHGVGVKILTGDNDLVSRKVCKDVGLSADPYGVGLDANGNPKVSQQDHVTVLLRPAAICFNSLFDNNNSNKHGQLVTPYLYADSADYTFTGKPAPIANTPIVPIDLLTNNDPSRVQVTPLVEAPKTAADGQTAFTPGKDPPANPGCLPQGRYAINVVYADGQAWTVPNEAGACTGQATGEGDTNWNQLTCTLQGRPVVVSQGPRAVVEVVAPLDQNNCKETPAQAVKSGHVPATPAMCLPTK